MSKAGLNFSPISGRILWGRTNSNGDQIGAQRDVTSEFIQVMEMKFPVNTYQKISVNGESKYAVIVVDLSKNVVVGGNIVQEGEA